MLRGVPLQADGYFFLPLWTNWQPGAHPGILDWYTVIGGLVALVALTLHGALWLTIKTSGDLEQRARRIVTPLWLALAALTVVSLVATIAVRPASLDNYFSYPFTFVVPVGVVASLARHLASESKGAAGQGVSLLPASTCSSCWPERAGGSIPRCCRPPPAPTATSRSSRALSGPHTLAVGLVWWLFGMALAVGYVVFVYSRFRGKVDLDAAGH